MIMHGTDVVAMSHLALKIPVEEFLDIIWFHLSNAKMKNSLDNISIVILKITC